MDPAYANTLVRGDTSVSRHLSEALVAQVVAGLAAFQQRGDLLGEQAVGLRRGGQGAAGAEVPEVLDASPSVAGTVIKKG